MRHSQLKTDMNEKFEEYASNNTNLDLSLFDAGDSFNPDIQYLREDTAAAFAAFEFQERKIAELKKQWDINTKKPASS